MPPFDTLRLCSRQVAQGAVDLVVRIVLHFLSPCETMPPSTSARKGLFSLGDPVRFAVTLRNKRS
jgi:hypothetical protein